MFGKIRCDGESWKFFGFWWELNKAVQCRGWAGERTMKTRATTRMKKKIMILITIKKNNRRWFWWRSRRRIEDDSDDDQEGRRFWWPAECECSNLKYLGWIFFVRARRYISNHGNLLYHQRCTTVLLCGGSHACRPGNLALIRSSSRRCGAQSLCIFWFTWLREAFVAPSIRIRPDKMVTADSTDPRWQ